MALNFDQLADRLEDKFDVSRTVVEAVVNDRQRRMITEARWRQSVRQIATTAAGIASYALPAGTIHLAEVKVGGVAYDWAPEGDLWRLDPGDSGHWFSVTDDENAVSKLQIAPAPETSGDAVTAIVTLSTDDLSYGTSAPRCWCRMTWWGFCMLGAARICTWRPMTGRILAAQQEQFFVEGVRKLRSRRNSLVGPRLARARIAGRDFEL
jgi:hypothetical protein